MAGGLPIGASPNIGTTLKQVLEDSQRDVPLTVIKLIVDKVTQSALCEHQHVSTILRKALAILYSRQDVDMYVARRCESSHTGCRY